MISTEPASTFKPSQLIRFCDEVFEVLTCRGSSGRVREFPRGDVIEPFYWNFGGESSSEVPESEARALKERYNGTVSAS